MTRILINLTAFNLVALGCAFACGWVSFSLGARTQPDNPVYTLHIYLALIAVTTTLGLHCLVFIYFLGTGRWVKEVSIAYGLTEYHPLPTLTRDLKRRAFPAALFAMLVPIAASAAGAGVATLGWSWLLHATGAVLTLAVNAWAFTVEYRCVRQNGAVIDDTMREVDRIRAERGLPTNDEALREQGQLSS